jgi:hypothetical protein
MICENPEATACKGMSGSPAFEVRESKSTMVEIDRGYCRVDRAQTALVEGTREEA